MRKKICKNQSWRKKTKKRYKKVFWKAGVKEDKNNMDEEEMKKQILLFTAVALSYCLFSLGIYQV